MHVHSRWAKKGLVVSLGTLILGWGFLIPAQAELEPNRTATQWGATLRAGGAFFSEDLDSSNFGPTLNGQIFYNLAGPRGQMGHDWNMGINADYEHHELDGTKAEIEVVTVMPFVEFRTRYDHWAPYFTTGVGMNFSAVTNEPSGVDIDAKNSLALKFGIGADWFITDHIALNTEAAWKLNKPDLKGSLAGTTVASGDGNFSVFQVLAGLRFYFGE
ncbi:MAG: hypothetical protein CO149_05445 [Nitrospirae bacterium CG_4_9_14_3_um_filter_51_5]|nr:MAG: hypothetical protein CO149_05445 [Nitrospirae bacterium CG_4_9_14_3_um_filter_51_5]